MKCNAPSPPRQLTGPTKVRAEGSQDRRTTTDPSDWVIRTPTSFLDARANPLGHRLGWMLLILEGHCRARCYCWVGNAALARAYGCAQSALLVILKELEAKGVIQRVAAPRGRPGRLGIILLRRANPDLPTASPEEISDVVRLMTEARAESRDRARGQTRLPFPAPVLGPEAWGLRPRPAPTARAARQESCRDDRGKPEPVTAENRDHHDLGKPRTELRVVVVKQDELKSDGPEAEPESESFSTTTIREEPPSEPALTMNPAPPAALPLPVAALVASIAGLFTRVPTRPAASPLRPPLTPASRATFPPAVAPPATGEEAAFSTRAWPAHVPRERAHRHAAAAVPVSLPARAAAPPSPPASSSLSPGQRAFLAALTPPQRARFESLPAADRERMLAPHRPGFDRVCAREAARKLAPPPDAAPPPPPVTTAALLERLPGGPAHWPQLAAEALARDFGTPSDRKLWPAFLQVTTAVCAGQFPAAALLDAYRQGMNPQSKNRGAVFNTVLQRHGWKWD